MSKNEMQEPSKNPFDMDALFSGIGTIGSAISPFRQQTPYPMPTTTADHHFASDIGALALVRLREDVYKFLTGEKLGMVCGQHLINGVPEFTRDSYTENWTNPIADNSIHVIVDINMPNILKYEVRVTVFWKDVARYELIMVKPENHCFVEMGREYMADRTGCPSVLDDIIEKLEEFAAKYEYYRA